MDEVVRGELAMLAQAGPLAQRAAKNLLDQIREKSARQGDYTAQVIASARTGSEGQAGLTAFFSKASPPWVVAIPDELKISQLLEHSES
jgi:methylglutaconyl-CoA hydratase